MSPWTCVSLPADPGRDHTVRRSSTLLAINMLALTLVMTAVSGGAVGAQAAAAAPKYPLSATVAVSPPTIGQQVQQARAALHAGIDTSSAGTAEKLTHPDRDRAGSSMPSQLKARAPGGRSPSGVQQSAAAAGQSGLDVSSYQGNVNWGAVARAGAAFAYMKATEGTSYKSTYFAGQYNGSYAAGLIRGAYHFGIPNSSTGAAQADFFIANGGGWSADGRTLPGMLDIEYNPYGPRCYGLSVAQMVSWIASFDTEYHRLTTRWPDIYTSTDWWNSCTGNSAAFGQESLSIANWSGSPLPLPHSWATHTFWQWADSGVFPGDQEVFNGSHQALVDFAAGRVLAAGRVAGAFTALSPLRVFDTRFGVGGPRSAVAAGATLSVPVVGVRGMPTSGVSAVVVNVTATQPAAAGYLTVYPSGAARPVAANLYFVRGRTAPKLVVVPVGADGKINLFNGSRGSVQLIGDLAGYYTSGVPAAAGAFRPVSLVRVLDTRFGVGGRRSAVAAKATRSVPVVGVRGMPTSGVSAVVVNVTVTQPAAAGYLTAYRSGAARPTASNLNFVRGQTVPNLVVVPVGADGKISLFNGSPGSVQLIGDIVGYYVSGAPAVAGAFGSIGPVRALNTLNGVGGLRSAVAPGATRSVVVVGLNGVPASGVSAVVLNVLVTQPAAAGYLTVHPDGAAWPVAANLNFVRGQTVPNLVVVPVGADGKIALFNGSPGSVQLIGDIAGYYLR